MSRPVARLAALLLAALALFLGTALAAQDFPARPEGPVLDAANILPPADEAALDAKLREYNRTTGRAVIVATVPSLGGLPADMFSQQLAEKWDIGGAATEQGVLMVVAPNEREVWITTARGVQTRLTDVSTGRIVRDTIIPQFKAGNMAGGIAAGVDAIIQRLDMDPAEAAALAEAEKAAAQNARNQGGGAAATVGGAIFWVAMILFFMFVFGRRGGRGRRHGMGSAIGNVILWNAIGSAMSHSSRGSDSWGGGGFGGGGGGGFGGFGGGGGGFNGGGAGGSW